MLSRSETSSGDLQMSKGGERAGFRGRNHFDHPNQCDTRSLVFWYIERQGFCRRFATAVECAPGTFLVLECLPECDCAATSPSSSGKLRSSLLLSPRASHSWRSDA